MYRMSYGRFAQVGRPEVRGERKGEGKVGQIFDLSVNFFFLTAAEDGPASAARPRKRPGEYPATAGA